MSKYKEIILAVTGASGSIYARRFIEMASALPDLNLNVIFSDTAKEVWTYETGMPLPENLVSNHDFNFKFCSGSAVADAVIILPCTMGTLARIAAGTANDVISRVADVQMKERRKIVIVPRETPYSLIHLRNMTALTEAGAIICPASPSFYSRPATLSDLTDSFVARVLQTAGLCKLDDKFKWNRI